MPVAKETLRIGFVIAAMPGNYISQEAVDTYGWSGKVEKGPDPVAEDTSDENATPTRKSRAAK